MQKIKFYPSKPEFEKILEEPVPSKKLFPLWYKELKPNIENTKLPRLKNHFTNSTAKKCMPMLDAMSSGYMIVLDGDVVINPEGYRFDYAWSTEYQLIGQHEPSQIGNLSLSDEFSTSPLKWMNYWTIKTPPGYSCLFTHPLGFYDLPFMTLSGIVDTDKYSQPVNFPFFLKKDFVGVIPKNTPIAQIIPIKRDKWKFSIENFNEQLFKNVKKFSKYIENGYKKMYWSKKEYI